MNQDPFGEHAYVAQVIPDPNTGEPDNYKILTYMGNASDDLAWPDKALQDWVEQLGKPGCTYQMVKLISQHYYCPTHGVVNLMVRKR